eukprot:TRINITY_DN104043_c0_g1_i1.p1 TRINITY_DN104043_c0_g1~~TRINITY_DN104043_c0_g1_i1.p1  ORF type:complete len:732 (+),score=65.57 TRINITY_DN104043_c0_g1_i1:141-2336(+)
MLLPISTRTASSSEASPPSTSLSGTPAPLLPIRARTSSNLELGAVGQERPRSRTDGLGGPQGLLRTFGLPSPSGRSENDDDSIQISVKNTFIDFGTSDTVEFHRNGAQTCQARFSEPEPAFFMDLAEEIAESPSDPPSQSPNTTSQKSAESRDTFHFDERSPLGQSSRHAPTMVSDATKTSNFEESLPLSQSSKLAHRMGADPRSAFHFDEFSPLSHRAPWMGVEAKDAFGFHESSPLSQSSRAAPRIGADARDPFGFEDTSPQSQSSMFSPKISAQARDAFHFEESSSLRQKSTFAPPMSADPTRHASHFEEAPHGTSCFDEDSHSFTSLPAYSGHRPHVSSPKASQLPDINDLFFMGHSDQRGHQTEDPIPDVSKSRAPQAMPKYISVPSAAQPSPAPGLKSFGYPASANDYGRSQPSFPAPPLAYAPPGTFWDDAHYPSTLAPPASTTHPPGSQHTALAGEVSGFDMPLERPPGRMARPNNLFIDTHTISGLFSPSANLANVPGLSPFGIEERLLQTNAPRISDFSPSASEIQRQQQRMTAMASSSPHTPSHSSQAPAAQRQRPILMAPGCLGTSPKSNISQSSPKSVVSQSSPKSFSSPSSRSGKKFQRTPAFPGGSHASTGGNAHGKLNADGQPACQPCAWFYKESGCLNAASCRYCHKCPAGELKQRKKEKVIRLRNEEAAEAAANMQQAAAGERMPDQPGLLPASTARAAGTDFTQMAPAYPIQ